MSKPARENHRPGVDESAKTGSSLADDADAQENQEEKRQAAAEQHEEDRLRGRERPSKRI
jgi:hypothetical protein